MPKIRELQVDGGGRFPLDMLRYDSCWPQSGEDVEKIAMEAGAPRRVIKLYTASPAGPTLGRWESFMWRVVK